MFRSEFPRRSRGSNRGPQIGANTFEARTSDDPDPARPANLGAVVWSPGPEFASVELWAYQTGYFPVQPTSNSDEHSMWLDVVDSSPFAPPAGPTDITTLQAFRTYARNRLFAGGAGVDVPESSWAVRVARPFAAAQTNSVKKFEVAQNHDPVYAIRQPESFGIDAVSWVWIRENGGREIWVHHLPDEGGFRVPGNVSIGETAPLISTQFLFEHRLDGPTGNTLSATGWPIGTYQAALEGFKEWIVAYGDGEVASKDDLVCHDYRVENPF